MRLTGTFVTTLRKQPKRLSYAGIKITIFGVGMQSVNPSIKPFCSLLRETTQVWLLKLCLPSLTGSGRIDGSRQFGALTSHTLVKKRGVFWTTLLVGHHTLLVTVPFQPMLLHVSQLVRNGQYEAVDHKSSRLVFQEVSDLRRATKPNVVNISDNFLQREFAAALQHLKPGKAPGPDSNCSELIVHAWAALKSWLRDFFSSCLRRLKISKIWSACGRDPKTNKARVGPKELSTDTTALCPLQDPREAYLAPRWAINRSTVPKEQAGFRREKSTVDQVVC